MGVKGMDRQLTGRHRDETGSVGRMTSPELKRQGHRTPADTDSENS
jgi:hypothetical protein